MTVKELITTLKSFPPNATVLIPDNNLEKYFPYNIANKVCIGVNELDGCVIICNYSEDEED